MAEYRLYFTQYASAGVTVEAEDLETAIEKAYEELPAEVCAQCSGWGRAWDLDLDGEWNLDEKSAAEDYPEGGA